MRAGALAAALLAGAALLLAPGTAQEAREAVADALTRLVVPRPEAGTAPVVAVAVGGAELAALGPCYSASVTGLRWSTPLSADPVAEVSLLSGVGAEPPPDGVR